jgi:hypothetical protein
MRIPWRKKPEKFGPHNKNMKMSFMQADSEGISFHLYLPIGGKLFDQLRKGGPHKDGNWYRDYARSGSLGEEECLFEFGPFDSLGEIKILLDYYQKAIGVEIEGYDEKEIIIYLKRVALHNSTDSIHRWINQGLFD